MRLPATAGGTIKPRLIKHLPIAIFSNIVIQNWINILITENSDNSGRPIRMKSNCDKMTQLRLEAPRLPLQDSDRVVIFSDLHLGNGRERDAFKRNSDLWLKAARKYYLENSFQLVLNGDVEELQRYRLGSVLDQWPSFYELLDEFKAKTALYRILGNHDHELLQHSEYPFFDQLGHSVKFDYKGQEILVFHGHQAYAFYEKYNNLLGFFLRYFAHPLHIKSHYVASDRRVKAKVEKRVYECSRQNRIISIIGHTHRPMFDSLSRVDFLKFKIERLCRAYSSHDETGKKSIESEISYFKDELHKCKADKNCGPLSGICSADVLVPCVFNSGCTIGKRGVTSIELAGGEIRLVHWFDARRSRKYFAHYENRPQHLPGTDYYRMVLKKEPLDYISSRIKLLA